MDDLISRQAAIDVVIAMYFRCDTGSLSDYRDLMTEALNVLPPAQLGTNLAEVGTRAVRGYSIDADALMEKVAEEYGERARYMLYSIIRYMPPAQPERDIPKRPNETIDRAWGISTRQAVCPNCDAYLGMVHFIGDGDNKKITYCESCGQAIDWTDWEDNDG